MRFKKPIHLIRYYKYLEYNNYAICDGMTNEFSINFSILYPLFIITGLTIFLYLMQEYDVIMDKLKNVRWWDNSKKKRNL